MWLFTAFFCNCTVLLQSLILTLLLMKCDVMSAVRERQCRVLFSVTQLGQELLEAMHRAPCVLPLSHSTTRDEAPKPCCEPWILVPVGYYLTRKYLQQLFMIESVCQRPAGRVLKPIQRNNSVKWMISKDDTVCAITVILFFVASFGIHICRLCTGSIAGWSICDGFLGQL